MQDYSNFADFFSRIHPIDLVCAAITAVAAILIVVNWGLVMAALFRIVFSVITNLFILLLFIGCFALLLLLIRYVLRRW